jgi:hypothetical protein
VEKRIKPKKPIPRINQVFAILVKSKGTQTLVASELGIRTQDLGYYMRGRKIPSDVISAWQDRYGHNLIDLAKSNFETDLETIVSRETKMGHQKDTKSTVVDTTISTETPDGQKPDQISQPTLLQILFESVRGVNKLVDVNNGLVDKLDKDKNWALAELEKLHAKFGVPKEAQQ